MVKKVKKIDLEMQQKEQSFNEFKTHILKNIEEVSKADESLKNTRQKLKNSKKK